MQALIRKAKQAHVQDDTKRYCIEGRVFSLGDAFRYFERKGIPRSRWDAGDIPYAPTPDGFRSWQPSRSSSPFNGSITDGNSGDVTLADVTLAETAFRQMFEDRIRAIQHHFAQIPSEPSPLPLNLVTRNLRKAVHDLCSVNLKDPYWTPVNKIRSVCDDVILNGFRFSVLDYHYLRTTHQHKKAHDTLTMVCTRVKSLLEMNGLGLLLYFLQLIAECRSKEYHELVNNLITLVAGQARELKGAQNPKAVVFASLLNQSRQTQDALMEQMLIDMFKLYKHYLKPPYTLDIVDLLLEGAAVLCDLKFYSTASVSLSWLQPMCYAFYGEKSMQMVICLLKKARFHLAIRELDQAKELLDYALVCCDGIEDRGQAGISKISCFGVLAVLWEQRGDVLQARYLLQLRFEAGREAGLEDEARLLKVVLALGTMGLKEWLRVIGL